MTPYSLLRQRATKKPPPGCVTLRWVLEHILETVWAQRQALCLDEGLNARAREHVQRRLAQLGLWKGGAWCLADAPRPQWPATGLKTSQVVGNKHPDVQALLDEPTLCMAVHTLLDGQSFDRTVYRQPQVLFTLPNSDSWTVPTQWHVDTPRLASGRRPGVPLFTFLDTVEARGGGTLVIAGSHRLLNEGRFIRMKELQHLLSREPLLSRTLLRSASQPPGSRALAGSNRCSGRRSARNGGADRRARRCLLHGSA
jgi:hypothetical protein